MSRQRRNFSAKFKSDLVIELLKGEKDLNSLATENNIQPNLLRNWKKEFLTTLPQCLMTSVRKTSKTSLLKNARKRRSMLKGWSVNHAG
ncbi:MAG: transposase [Enterocloster clostridioformis]